jgi:tRNA (adenine22-N1)-methyltransferase
MYNKRIKVIASLISNDDIILDIGCDHAYLPIYLIRNNIVQHAYASDISTNAIKNAINNVNKYKLENKIDLYVADGVIGIPYNYNTIVISGMGTSNIKKIIDNAPLVGKIVLSSNNDYYDLRIYMKDKGYKITNEIVCFDRGKYYPVIVYQLGKDNISKEELYFGKSYSKDYYLFLKDKYEKILNNMPNKTNANINKYINYLDKLLKKCR